MIEPYAAAALGPLGDAVEVALGRLVEGDVVRRLWARDHTLWSPDPTEISDRLGWLDLPDLMYPQCDEYESVAAQAVADGFERVVLLGMGGSSLAAEVFAGLPGRAARGLPLRVLDTTDPGEIATVEGEGALDRTLFLVASKSGTTIETVSQLAYFWERTGHAGSQFIVVTDPGTKLDERASADGFRWRLLGNSFVGGRYSALSAFGQVPAALAGVDLHAHQQGAKEMAAACRGTAVEGNPGAWLGAVLGAAHELGRDKLTLVLPGEIAALGDWIEQLVAESTGKDGRGLLPVVGEPLAAPEMYGDDRLVVAYGEHEGLAALEGAGQPVVRLPYGSSEPARDLGGEFFRWEVATAIAGQLIGIQPFDQPDVQAAKDATARILGGADVDASTPPPAEVLGTVGRHDYVALQAFVARTPANVEVLERTRAAIRMRHRVATTVGFGPRFLHSTGQLHKGGRDAGVFVQVVGEDARDLEVPGAGYTFGELKRAQALGDLDALRARGRRVARVTMAELEELAG